MKNKLAPFNYMLYRLHTLPLNRINKTKELDVKLNEAVYNVYAKKIMLTLNHNIIEKSTRTESINNNDTTIDTKKK
jgi:hypothetical protein